MSEDPFDALADVTLRDEEEEDPIARPLTGFQLYLASRQSTMAPVRGLPHPHQVRRGPRGSLPMKHLWRGVTFAAVFATMGWLVWRPTGRQTDAVIKASTESMMRTVRAVQGPPYVPPPPPPRWAAALQLVGGVLFWLVVGAAVVGVFGGFIWAMYLTMGDEGPAVAIVILLLSVLVGTQLGRTR